MKSSQVLAALKQLESIGAPLTYRLILLAMRERMTNAKGLCAALDRLEKQGLIQRKPLQVNQMKGGE